MCNSVYYNGSIYKDDQTQDNNNSSIIRGNSQDLYRQHMENSQDSKEDS